MTEQEIKALRKENRELRKNLEHLAMSVRQFTAWLDREMRKPSDFERGRRVAKTCNAMDRINDSIRFGVLRENFRRPKRMKPIPIEIVAT